MGGSGGGYIPNSTDVDSLIRRVREAERTAADEAFEAEASKYLAEQLAQYNDRDVAAVNQILEEVAQQLEKDIDGTLSLVFGGSVSKHTYVDGLSDVDALVLISRDDAEGKSPSDIRKGFAERLASRYGADKVTDGVLAVTLKVSGHEIQLLPALRKGSNYQIAGPGAREWIDIRPREFATALTSINKAMDGKLVPVVKLAKAVISNLPEPRQLTGYHTEALALKMFEKYEGSRTPKVMLMHFFANAASLVRTPLPDVTGQSRHLDAYLGAADSIQRRIAADALERTSRRMRNADGAQSLDRWKEILEGPAD